jgi:hypothetical protein
MRRLALVAPHDAPQERLEHLHTRAEVVVLGGLRRGPRGWLHGFTSRIVW